MNDWKTREDRMGKECGAFCYFTIVLVAVAVGIILLEMIF